MARARLRAIGRPSPIPDDERESPLDTCSKCSKIELVELSGTPGPLSETTTTYWSPWVESLDQNLIPAVFSSVLEQVPDHLLDPLGVGMCPHTVRNRHRGLAPAAGREDEECHLLDHRAEVEDVFCEPQAPSLEPGNYENVLDQVAEIRGLLADVPEELGDLLLGQRVSHEAERVWAKPAMLVSGVRNSWLTIDTKSFLMCLASSAS